MMNKKTKLSSTRAAHFTLRQNKWLEFSNALRELKPFHCKCIFFPGWSATCRSSCLSPSLSGFSCWYWAVDSCRTFSALRVQLGWLGVNRAADKESSQHGRYSMSSEFDQHSCSFGKVRNTLQHARAVSKRTSRVANSSFNFKDARATNFSVICKQGANGKWRCSTGCSRRWQPQRGTVQRSPATTNWYCFTIILSTHCLGLRFNRDKSRIGCKFPHLSRHLTRPHEGNLGDGRKPFLTSFKLKHILHKHYRPNDLFWRGTIFLQAPLLPSHTIKTSSAALTIGWLDRAKMTLGFFQRLRATEMSLLHWEQPCLFTCTIIPFSAPQPATATRWRRLQGNWSKRIYDRMERRCSLCVYGVPDSCSSSPLEEEKDISELAHLCYRKIMHPVTPEREKALMKKMIHLCVIGFNRAI